MPQSAFHDCPCVLCCTPCCCQMVNAAHEKASESGVLSVDDKWSCERTNEWLETHLLTDLAKVAVVHELDSTCPPLTCLAC